MYGNDDHVHGYAHGHDRAYVLPHENEYAFLHEYVHVLQHIHAHDDVRGRETASQQNQQSQEPPRRQSVLDNDGNNARGSVQTYQRGQYESQRQSSSRQQESGQVPRQRRGSRRH